MKKTYYLIILILMSILCGKNIALKEWFMVIVDMVCVFLYARLCISEANGNE